MRRRHILAAGTILVAAVTAGVGLHQSPRAPLNAALVPAPPACTLYAAPTAHGTGAGTSPANAGTLQSVQHTQVGAGSVVCLTPGIYPFAHVFYLDKSGTARTWIVYRPQHLGPSDTPGSPDVLLTWTGPACMGTCQFWNAYQTAYIEVYGLTFEGQNRASDLFISSAGPSTPAHHIRFYLNRVQDMAYNCIGATRADYVDVEQNDLYHCGYLRVTANQASGVSLNQLYWHDRMAGFHNIVAYNRIAGVTDLSTGAGQLADGNGIILDLPWNHGSGTTDYPTTLVADNVVYNNGGSCIADNQASHVYIINNTCYKNGLNTALARTHGELQLVDTVSPGPTDIYWLNNIAWAWWTRPPFAHGRAAASTEPTAIANIQYEGGTDAGLPVSIAGNLAAVLSANPDFRRPPRILPYPQDGQYSTAVPPWALGTALTLGPGSPARTFGVDPYTLLTDSTLAAQVDTDAGRSITGAPRTSGAWSVGAY